MATTKTPAEIPAETAAAHRTEYDPVVAIDLINPHAHNIRHDAVADEALVESVREKGLFHPLVLRPGGVTGLTYTLVDGHRRLDALKKAGYTHAPAIIRHDLQGEADEIAAMLVTDHKEKLTPIEEAEGYDLLSEIGWSDADIAKAAGRSQRTVIQRRKLTRLPEKAKTAVHAGQVTIEDAITLAQLPRSVAKDVEKYLGQGSFKYEVQRARERATRIAEVDAQVKDLTKQGIPELPWPKGCYNEYYLNHADHGMVRLSETGVPDAGDHIGCLAYTRAGTRQYPLLYLVCTDPGQHEEQLTEVQKDAVATRAAADAEREQRIQEQRERKDRERIARQLRVDSILAGVKLPKLDHTFADLLSIGYPALLELIAPSYADPYRQALGIPAEQWSPQSWEPESEYLDSLQHASATDLLKALVAHLVLEVERSLAGVSRGGVEVTSRDQVAATRYGDLLDQVGHGRNDVDDELLSTVISADLETDEDEEE